MTESPRAGDQPPFTPRSFEELQQVAVLNEFLRAKRLSRRLNALWTLVAVVLATAANWLALGPAFGLGLGAVLAIISALVVRYDFQQDYLGGEDLDE